LVLYGTLLVAAHRKKPRISEEFGAGDDRQRAGSGRSCNEALFNPLVLGVPQRNREIGGMAMGEGPLKFGVLGAGMIATVDYGVLPNLHYIREKATVVAIADPVIGLAQSVARRFDIPLVYGSLDEMLEGAPIEAVLNLTPIPIHSETSIRILQAGKHLATEKPLAATLDDATAIIDLAKARGLTIVCSPPQMLYPSRREARRLIRDGAIGRVAFARVRSSMSGPAARAWPTDPTWFYQEGSGPLFDLGVYGLHEITGILGPAKRVAAFSGITEATRIARGGPFDGKRIDVTADDNTLMMLDFGESKFAVVDASYNVSATKSPKIEIFGLGGVLVINMDFAEVDESPAIEVFRGEAVAGLEGWITPTMREVRSEQLWADRLGRAILVDHLADCIQSGARPVLSADHARHVLEIMLKAQESARSGRILDLTTAFLVPGDT
jgi:predicted dehydrogenase